MSGTGGMHIGLDIKVFEPCPIHQTPDKTQKKTMVVKQARWPFFHIEKRRIVPQCDCPKVMSAHNFIEHDLSTKNFCGILMSSMFNTAIVTAQIYDTSNTTHTMAAGKVGSAIQIVAGSGVTAPNAGTDRVVETQLAGSDGAITPTYVGTASANGTINTTTSSTTTFLIVGAMTNSTLGNETWGNIGIYGTFDSNIYLLAHDQTNGATGYVVSASGTVAVTYIITCT
jgi:hypothetical protein